MSAETFDKEKLRKKILKRIPLGRIGDPNKLGSLIVYLSSDASNFLTGQTFYIDGGELTSG